MRPVLGSLLSGRRSAIISFNGLLEADELADLDQVARRELPTLTEGPVRREVEYRTLADASGTDFVLAATDRLAGAVRLVSGRMPSSCTATRCEVVEIVPTAGDFAGTTADVADLGLVVVGTVERTDPLLLSGTFDPGSLEHHWQDWNGNGTHVRDDGAALAVDYRLEAGTSRCGRPRRRPVPRAQPPR